MAAVLAEVHGNAVSSGELALGSSDNRIGFSCAAGLADGGDMVDVDVQTGHGNAYRIVVLRITAGEHRGRRLRVPDVRSTRPLVARAREALFDRLGGIEGEALVWDVFAGSGILGFEALSRGADRVIAIERSGKAAESIRSVATELGYDEARHKTLRGDARRFLESDLAVEDPQLVLFDPPYAAFRGAGRREVWELFCSLCGRLSAGGAGAVHTPKGVLTDSEKARLPGIAGRNYGDCTVYVWWRSADGEDGPQLAT